MASRDDQRSSSRAFIALLIEDVIAAQERLRTSGTQTTRREVVRASISAIEGSLWIAREHVRTALASVGMLSPIADLALQELAYTVSPTGQISEQARGLPILTTVRLVVEQARIMSPEITVDFSRSGWSNLRRAIEIRNRITHPKPDQNLAISDADLAAVDSGMLWLQATVEYVMASTNLTLVEYTDAYREIVQLLRTGDPEALAAYETALREIETDD